MSGSWVRRLFGSTAKINDATEFRSGSDDSVGQTPTPLSRDRIAQYLDRHDYHYEVDNDGDLTGLWDGNQLWFLLMGDETEILQVRGRWHDSISMTRRLSALRTINDWNRDRVWPKVYLREEGPGLSLYAEVSFDLEHGVTDSQLHQYLECAVVTSTMLLNSAPTMFSSPVS